MLIVVDMQYEFIRTARPVLKQVVDAVSRAVKVQMPVCFVEYAGGGATFQKIADAAKSFGSEPMVVYKGCDDAGPTLIRRYGICEQETFLCGVNGSFCIRETYETLKSVGWNCNLLIDAIGCSSLNWTDGYEVPPQMAELDQIFSTGLWNPFEKRA